MSSSVTARWPRCVSCNLLSMLQNRSSCGFSSGRVLSVRLQAHESDHPVGLIPAAAFVSPSRLQLQLCLPPACWAALHLQPQALDLASNYWYIMCKKSCTLSEGMRNLHYCRSLIRRWRPASRLQPCTQMASFSAREPRTPWYGCGRLGRRR